MTPSKFLAAIALALTVSGCAAVELPSRNAPFEVIPGPGFSGEAGQMFQEAQIGSVQVVDLRVSVPQSLIVSEENSYYPMGDIVWRGEPGGDRHRQVQRIFEEAFLRGTSGLEGTVPVVLDVEVERFHSVTEKTRYTFGGVHSIRFAMILYHAETGQPLTKRKVVKANLKAFGGQRAINAERQGQTQRVRVVDHLSNTIQSELGRAPRSAAPVAGLVLDDQAAF